MERNLTIINYSVIRTDIRVRDDRVINRGVDIDHVRRMTKQTISRHELAPADRPGQSRVREGRVEIYNPIIRQNESAHPDKVLEKDEVLDRITRTTMREPEEQAESQKIRLKDAQKQEFKHLENSQEKELQQVIRKKQQEEGVAKDATEKQKIKKEYDQKVVKIKQSHEKEKTEIKKRHKKEDEQIKKKKIKKKEIKK
jgi:small-conductance mechanosensitive channel